MARIVPALIFLLSFCLPAPAQPPLLRLEREIALPGVHGRIDHLSVDLAGQRVFISALGNGSIEVVDLKRGTRIGEIRGLSEPQGVLYVPANGDVYVASGGDGTVRSFSGTTLQPRNSITLGDDADNLRLDTPHNRILAGFGDGAIAVMDLNLAHHDDYRLPAHPESFQLAPGGQALYVNLPDHHSIGTIQLANHEVDAEWSHPGPAANFPMALDPDHSQIFIACRRPAQLLALDAKTGHVTAQIPTVGDADDLFYDVNRHLLYVIGGEGFIDVVRAQPGGPLVRVARIKTAPGARTGLYIPYWKTLVVVAPQRGNDQARLLVFSTDVR